MFTCGALNCVLLPVFSGLYMCTTPFSHHHHLCSAPVWKSDLPEFLKNKTELKKQSAWGVWAGGHERQRFNSRQAGIEDLDIFKTKKGSGRKSGLRTCKQVVKKHDLLHQNRNTLMAEKETMELKYNRSNETVNNRLYNKTEELLGQRGNRQGILMHLVSDCKSQRSNNDTWTFRLMLQRTWLELKKNKATSKFSCFIAATKVPKWHNLHLQWH